MSDQDGWKGRAPVPTGTYGPILAELAKIDARLNNLETRSALTSASISSGGLTVRDGGGVTVEDGGGLVVQDGGGVTVEDGGGLTISDGGGVEVQDGGSFSAAYASGATGAFFGPLVIAGTTTPDGFGLLVQEDGTTDQPDIFRAKQNQNGTTGVYIGQTSPDVHVGEFVAHADLVDIHGTTTGVYSDDDAMVSAGGGGLTLWAADDVTMHANGALVLTSGAFTLKIPWSTMSAASNMYLDADGRIWKVSSSLKYKQDVEDYSADPADVLKLRPRTWRDKGEVERDPDTTNRYVGFIAEEVQAAGLTELVVHDEDGNPDSLSYDRMLAAYHAVIAQQQQTITDLAARVAALEGTSKEATP